MIKADASESKVKDEVKKLLKQYGAYYFMPPANGFGRSGIPDIVACYRGQFVSIECKAPARWNNVSELQKREGCKIREAGGVWRVVHDDETLHDLETLLLAMEIAHGT